MQESFYTLPGPAACRIALLADLHSRPCEEALASLRARRPDMICVAGDFVHGFIPRGEPGLSKVEDSARTLPFLRACAELAPCFVSLGNHEWMLDEGDYALVRETGVTLLDNEWLRHGPFVIGGLSSGRVKAYRAYRAEAADGTRYPLWWPRSREANAYRPDAGWLRDYAAEPGFKLLLCHHPEYWPELVRELPVELTLSGHAHGGQIRLFGRGLYAPGQGLLPRYTAGVHEGRLVVSRGLANTVVVPRVNNPPELVYIDLM
jgi:hypothetical protein